MFAVNGNRPGPNPNGQSYGEILRAAKLEERAHIIPPSDHNGEDLEPLSAALGVRNDRIVVQSEIEPYDILPEPFDTSRGTLGFAFGYVFVRN